MPGPAPVVPYSGVPSVEPDTRTREGYVGARASPDDFGGAIGGALERGGNQLRGVGDEFAQEALRQQGMINETMATNAETQYLQQLGKMQGDFYTKEGFAAGASLQDHTAQISAARQAVGDTLTNPFARRAYDMVSRRHEANAIMDANRYASGQIKTANVQAFSDSLTTTISRAGDLNTALDDYRFDHDVLGRAQHAVDGILQNRGYMDGTGYSRSADGDVTFDDSDAGKAASAVRQEKLDQAYGQAWEMRLKVVSDQDIIRAKQIYDANRDRVPPATQAKMDAFFTPKLRDLEIRGVGDSAVSDAATGYTGKPGAAPPAMLRGGAPTLDNNVGNIRASNAAWDGKGDPEKGFETFATPEQGAAAVVKNLRSYGDVTLRQAIAKWAPKSDNNDPEAYTASVEKQTGLDGDMPIPFGDPAKMASLVKAMSSVEKGGVKFGDDVFDAGVQLASGGAPKTTQPSPPGPFAPGVGTPGRGNIYETQADYFGRNYDAIASDAYNRGLAAHPGDIRFAELSQAHAENRMNNVIRQQEAVYRADGKTVMQALNGTNGKVPQSVEELTADPAVKDAWDRLEISNPIAVEHIKDKLLGKGDRDTVNFGPGFDKLLFQIHPMDGSQPTLTDPNQLFGYYHSGGDDSITWRGMTMLQSELAGRKDEGGQRQGQVEAQELKRIRDAVLQEREIGGAKFVDPKGEQMFRMAQQEFYDTLESPREGSSRADMLNPFGNDYIVDNIINRYKRSLDDQMADTAQETPQAEKMPEGMDQSIRENMGENGALKGATDYTPPRRAPDGNWYTTVTYADGSRRPYRLAPEKREETNPAAIAPGVSIPFAPFPPP